MSWRVLSLFLVGSLCGLAAPSGCVGSLAVNSFRLMIKPGSEPGLPIRELNNLPAGARITYRPLDLPADMKRDAKLTLVLVPEDSNDSVTVLEPKLAAVTGEWTAPFKARIVLLVFAPQGLDEKRLTNLVTKDDALVATLADYADETADLEAQLENAQELQQEAEEPDHGTRATTPAEQALFSLVRALNPANSSFDPLGAGRLAGPATLVGQGESAFFENAGGMFPGGGVLPVVKQWLLPDTEFRSVYAIPDDPDGMTLCTRVQPKGKNKIAYLWAYRMQGGGAPKLSLEKDTDAPIGLRDTLAVRVEHVADWRPVSRIFGWTLVSDGGKAKPLAVHARIQPEQRALIMNLRLYEGAPGPYHIEGRWDWGTVKVAGTLRLHNLDDFKTAVLTGESQDKLISGTGIVPIELTGADFVFVDHVWVHRTTSARQIPADLPVDRSGPTDRLTIEVNTDGLRPGPYLLSLARVDGEVTDLPIRLLAAPPRLDTSGARVNLGDRADTVTLTGSGLERIDQLEAAGADITLQPASEDGTRREIKVALHPDAKAGDRLELSAKVTGMNGLLRFPGVLQVAASRPRIVDAKVSVPTGLAVSVRDGEVPAGSWVNFVLNVDPATSNATLTLQCADPAQVVQPLKLHTGEKQDNAQLSSAGPNSLFLSLQPGAVGQSGCQLTAAIETEELGKSDPFPLAKVVRLPRIESFTMTDDKSPEGFFGELKGWDLDTIAKTGWGADMSADVPGLPSPAAGEGSKQSLRISMPWPSPSPKAPLFLWLRGESGARVTKVVP